MSVSFGRKNSSLGMSMVLEQRDIRYSVHYSGIHCFKILEEFVRFLLSPILVTINQENFLAPRHAAACFKTPMLSSHNSVLVFT